MKPGSSNALQLWGRFDCYLAAPNANLRGRAVAHVNRQIILESRETITLGLDKAPDALLGLLTGKNLGKQLIKLVP